MPTFECPRCGCFTHTKALPAFSSPTPEQLARAQDDSPRLCHVCEAKAKNSDMVEPIDTAAKDRSEGF